jgi:pyruvate dehydrogenase E2 component (dihydrolipoamide acetyltransferase)
MARIFKFQDPGEGIHEAEVLRILVSPNEEVKEGQEVFEVETDKANFDLSCPYDGIVERIHVQEGDRIQVGDSLLTVGEGDGASKAEEAGKGHEEEDQEDQEEREKEPEVETEDETREKKSPSPRSSEEQEKERRKERKPAPVKPSTSEKEPSHKQEPVQASPATRRVARELNIDLRDVTSSGEEGRVLTSDVRAFAESQEMPAKEKKREHVERKERPAAAGSPALPDFAQWGPVQRKPLRSVRRETAKRMAVSWSQIPHVTHNDVADISELEKFRQRHVGAIAARGGKLTLTVLIMKAVVGALHEFPSFNASLDPEAEEIIFKSYYHLGVALDSERGLLVPVIRDVDRKSASDLAVELFELAERVRTGKVSREEMMGSTFTITNPGPLGGTSFTPIINFPEVAILGLGRARLQPVARGSLEEPEIVARLMLPLSLAFDHRVNDGALAARFVNRIIQALTDLEIFALMV